MEKRETIIIKNGIFYKILEGILYLLVINFSYVLPMYIGYHNKYLERNVDAYYDMWIYITICSVFVLLFNKFFQTLKLSKTENIIIVFSTTFMIGFLTTAIAFIVRSFALPRSVILMGFIIQTILFILIKLSLKHIFDKLMPYKNVAIISSISMREEVIEKIFGSKYVQKEKLIYISELNSFSLDLLENINKIYIYNLNNNEHMDELIHHCILRGVQICIVPNSYELSLKNSNFNLRADLPLLKINKIGLSMEYKFVKRLIDIFLSSLAIVIFLPFMIVVYFLILLKDGGKPIFKQKRVTINNEVFTLYKFRTMIIDAEKETGAVWSTENDPRITKLGVFLRKFWLDELPQFFNVLKGDMSFVGPRPERPELVEEFIKKYPDFKYRTIAKCGLTGYAQVMARYETKPENKLKFDLFYILNANLILDLNIIILTIRKIFLRLINHEQSFRVYDEIIESWEVSEIKEDADKVYYYYK